MTKTEAHAAPDCLAVSTVGAFGSNEFMQRMCGDSTIEIARAAKKAGASFA